MAGLALINLTSASDEAACIVRNRATGGNASYLLELMSCVPSATGWYRCPRAGKVKETNPQTEGLL